MINKVSDKDNYMKKIRKWEKHFQKFSLDDKEECMKLGKEFRKIRLKTLKKLLLCYTADFDSFKYGGGEFGSVKQVQNILKCGKREAYDYWRTMQLISTLQKLIDTEVYKTMGKLAKLEADKDKQKLERRKKQ